MHFHVRFALRARSSSSFYQPIKRTIARSIRPSINQPHHSKHVRTFSIHSINQTIEQSHNQSNNPVEQPSSQSIRSVKLAQLKDIPAPFRSHYCNQLSDLSANQSTNQSNNQTVSLAGFVESVRLIGDLFFAVLRDSTGSVQLVWSRSDAVNQSNTQSIQQFDSLHDLTIESFIAVKGVLRHRPDQSVKKSNKQPVNQSFYHAANNAALEVSLTSLFMLSHAATNLPLNLQQSNQSTTQSIKEGEEVRLTHRYLDLRRSFYQSILQLRSDLSFAVRQSCYQSNYQEIETPVLFKSTPEGAREFLVPSRLLNQPNDQSVPHPADQSRSLFYALPQSPQQMKQVLMSSGVEKYFQFARCFRDEGQRADRQPEFTQLDLEFACKTEEQIRREMEIIVNYALDSVLNRTSKQSNNQSDTTSKPTNKQSVYQPADRFHEMKFADAMNNYGVDKPDVRYSLTIQQVSNDQSVNQSNQSNQPIVKFIRCPGLSAAMSRKEFDQLQKDNPTVGFVRVHSNSQSSDSWKMPAKLKQRLADINQLDHLVSQSNAQAGDLIILSIGANNQSISQSLGRARINVSSVMASHDLTKPLNSAELKLLWIVDFPLFDMDLSVHYTQSNCASTDSSYTLEQVGLAAMHHPFTAPHEDDLVEFQKIMKEIWQHANNQSINQSNQPINLRSVPLPFHLIHRLSSIRGQHYDLVCNGIELGGGSVRIHSSDNQRSVFDLLHVDHNLFIALLHALDAGCPPHGGLAIGWDRFVAMVAAVVHPTRDGQALPIRDVIAFPKTTTGKDLLFQTPTTVTHKQMQEYHLKV